MKSTDLNPNTDFPKEYPYKWAHDWGEDEHGVWVAFAIAGVRQEMRWIPPGSFMMGSPVSQLQRNEDEFLHQVSLGRGFWLGETTITQALWQVIMGDNPSCFKGKNLPVESISWFDADEFIRKLNAMQTGLEMRLPSEAEWEYACRAGTETLFSFGENLDTSIANFDASDEKVVHAGTVDVSVKPSNPWGLYQMHGNVWEWCRDWYAEYPNKHVQDPLGPDSGEERILRGGSWVDESRRLRSACRGGVEPYNFGADVGFRLARGPD